jgi:ABC-type nitrate/sulfonate/bicarbonate transport system substrate-binding protein
MFRKAIRRLIVGAAMATCLVTTPAVVSAQPLTEIKVSYQHAYWALPFFVATEKGWWAELGLKPNFSVFPAGVPQIAASASKSWDVGGTGGVPAVLGHVRFGIKTIGLSNDESAGNALMATKATAEKYAANPKLIKGQTIVLTANSTGDYAVQSCLKKFGLAKGDVTIKNMGQAEIISAMSSNNADLGGLWAPNIYTLEEQVGGKVICSGKEGDAFVPGALIVRGDYAKDNPQNVAKFLAIYLRALKYMSANRADGMVMIKKFYEQAGIKITDTSMRREFDTRPVYDLAGQLRILDRSKGASQMDNWFVQMAAFMVTTGAIPAAPASREYITDEFIKMVNSDPKLREFANRTN